MSRHNIRLGTGNVVCFGDIKGLYPNALFSFFFTFCDNGTQHTVTSMKICAGTAECTSEKGLNPNLTSCNKCKHCKTHWVDP